MKLEDLKYANVLARPANNRRSIPDGTYNGETTNAEFVERDSQYSEDGKRVVLNIKVEVQDEDGDAVDLYLAPNYSWSKRGKMMNYLEKLAVLPAPGESINLDEIVGIPVQVTVRNVEIDGETYSNIVNIERIKTVQSQRTNRKKAVTENSNVSERSAMEERSFVKQSATTELDDLFDENGSIEIDDFDDFFDED